MYDTKAHAQITGTVWENGTPRTVSGFPIRQGFTGNTVAMVDILTPEGVIERDVQVQPANLDGVRLERLFAGASDEMLWRIADRDARGCGGRALAEIAYRESLRVKREAADKAARIARSRRDAARLLAA